MVAKGYKQTEIGVIPDDWGVKKLGEVCDVRDGTHDSPKYVNDGVFFITSKNIVNSKLDYKDVNLISQEDANKINQRSKVDKGDIIMSMIGTIGNAVLIDFLPDFCIKNVALLKPQKINNFFLIQLINSNLFQSYIESKLDGGIQKFISLGVLRELEIVFPIKQQEQTAIATALSDMDSLISSLEALIAKKRLIKQGAMKTLLQPKEGWEVKKLGEIGRPYGGLSGKSKDDFKDGESKYIPFMNIMSNPIIDTTFLDYVKIRSGESQNQALKGDLFFNGSSETPEEVGMCSILLETIPNLYLNSFCFGFRLKNQNEINGLYLSYYFRSDFGRKLFYSMAQGATRYNLSKANFNKLEITFPSYDEQTRIATILSDMDTEIAALETKLDKYKLIKQGMMTNLLTGKIRLV